VEEHSVAQGIWPQCKVNFLKPASASVQQLLARTLREIADGALGDAILEVSVYATEGELLARVMARLLECIVRETTVVTVIMLIFYSVLGGKGLEGAFGGNDFD
jgi:hypothetical protein